MNPSRRHTRPWQWTVAVVSLVGVGARAVAGELLLDLFGSRLGNAVGAVLVLALVVTSLSLLLRWRARRNPRPGEPDPPEPQPATGVAQGLPHLAGFVGRERALDDIEAKCDRAVAVVGRRGVGTSACVKQAAARLRDRAGEPPPDDGNPGAPPRWSPDSVVYVNLRSGQRPLPSYDLMVALTHWVETPAPVSADDADVARSVESLRRHLVDQDRRLLLVLDDVDDPNQVRPLLPLPAQCRVLLAGCPELSRLEGVAECWIGEPTPAEAAAMFVAASHVPISQAARRLDPSTNPALRQLIELCGRMPRPVRALGYRMARHGWQPEELLETLRRLMVAPAHQEVRYSAALDLIAEQDVAYTALSPPARRLYRLLAVAAGPLEPDAVAALWRPRWLAARPWPRPVRRWARERSAGRVSGLLHELAVAGFVESPKGDVRIRQPYVTFAELHLRRDEVVRSRVRAEIRLTRHLARKAERQVSLLATPSPLTRSGRSHDDAYDEDPCDWFERHHRSLRRLVAHAAGSSGGAARLEPRRLRRWWFRVAVALCGWYAAVDALHDWEWTCTKVLETPTAGDRWRIASWARNELGVIQRRRGDPAGAHDVLSNALRARGHWGEAQVLTNLGLALLEKGDETVVHLATWHLRVAKRHRSPGDRRGRAKTDLGLGRAFLATGELSRAHDHLQRAARHFDHLHDLAGAAAARTNLGLVQWQLGAHLEARETLEMAAAHYTELQEITCAKLADPRGRAAALLNLGAALVTTEQSLAPRHDGGDRRHAARAYDLLDEGLALRARDLPTPGLGRTRLYLGDAARLLGRLPEARWQWDQAAEICQGTGDPDGETAARRRLRTYPERPGPTGG